MSQMKAGEVLQRRMLLTKCNDPSCSWTPVNISSLSFCLGSTSPTGKQCVVFMVFLLELPPQRTYHLCWPYPQPLPSYPCWGGPYPPWPYTLLGRPSVRSPLLLGWASVPYVDRGWAVVSITPLVVLGIVHCHSLLLCMALGPLAVNVVQPLGLDQLLNLCTG